MGSLRAYPACCCNRSGIDSWLMSEDRGRFVNASIPLSLILGLRPLLPLTESLLAFQGAGNSWEIFRYTVIATKMGQLLWFHEYLAAVNFHHSLLIR